MKCNCEVRRRSIINGVAILLFLGFAEKSTAAPPGPQSSSSILVPVSAPQSPQPPVSPIQPKADCFGLNSFPGTPAWNECFKKFSQDMASYPAKMQEYMKSKSQVDTGSSGESASMRVGPGNYFSGSTFMNSNTMSTSNSFTGGYAIHAVNMGLSTSMVNNFIKVKLYAGTIDKYDSTTNGNEIIINVVSKGQRKYARVQVPKGINPADVKVERSSDSVYVSGPTSSNEAGTFHISQSESTGSGSGASFSSGSVSQNIGQMPVMPMPEFQNMFQNIFQNVFSSIFGGRSMLPMQGDSYAKPGSGFSVPQMWFY